MTSLPSPTRDRSPTEGSDCGGPHTNLFEYDGGPSRSQASSLLVIIHYLLKNNIGDFNTQWLSKITGGAPRCVLTGICGDPSHCEAIV